MLAHQPERRYHIVLLALLSAGALAGCQSAYYLQAARGQAGVLMARRSLVHVIEDPRTPPALSARLKLFRDAREFASQQLGLPDNRSYRSYADLHRDYAVWNVVAAAEFAVVPRQWCFPVAGCVAYRGYFHQRSAQRFAARLRKKGDDVIVGGVSAYSTLGRFADPLLSTQLRYDDVEVVGILFHELAHQQVYVRGDSSFNESFATTVGEVGLARWLQARQQGADLDHWRAGQERQRVRVQRIAAASADLSALYREKMAPDAMRERKRLRFEQLAHELNAAPPRALNNADLVAAATYFDCVPGFERELAAVDGDLPRFYQRVRELARLTAPERRARLSAAE